MKCYPALICCCALVLGGCATWDGLAFRSQSPEGADDAPKTKLVGTLTTPYGLFPVRAEAVALVTGLPGTGSDPGPSPERGALVAEMRTRGVDHPNNILNSKTASLVLARAMLRPGIQKGERVDVEVRVPSRSETTSLRGGWLLETRLKELAVLDRQVHDGHVLALAEGPILVDPSAQPDKDRVATCRGRILGGAVVLKSRILGLVLTPGNQTVGNSARVATVVNNRFHTVQKSIQVGVAKAKTDQLIELTIHPRYKDNVDRYVQVVRAIAMKENSAERMARIERLQRELLDPLTAGAAARQLEALGRDGVESLRKGLEASDREVRFFAAEALAYLDRREAAEPLAEMARQEPAFRVFALGALGAMDDSAARDQLEQLLHVPSAETRYGAFRALWVMNPSHPLVAGDAQIKAFHYSVVDSAGPPMIHVTRNRRPEVVLFGLQQRFSQPLALNAGPNIMITSTGSGEVAVSKYVVGQADQKRIVSTSVDEVIRAIVDLGGTYPDVVQALGEAKAARVLASRFEVDALPEAGRSYERMAANSSESPSRDGAEPSDSGGFPSLPEEGKEPVSSRRSGPFRSFLVRMMGRDAE